MTTNNITKRVKTSKNLFKLNQLPQNVIYFNITKTWTIANTHESLQQINLSIWAFGTK